MKRFWQRRHLPRGVAAILWGLMLAAGPTSGAAQGQPAWMTTPETTDLGQGLYVFRLGAYRSIFQVSTAGVIATDPSNPPYAQALRAAIAEITDQPVRYVAYSHSHWDRTAGGQIFKEEGAQFVAQERCAENLRETPHPDVILPDITYADRMTLALGEQRLDLHYFGPAHDTCMSVMVAKPRTAMFIVNIVNPPAGMVPWNPTIPHLHPYNIIPFFKSAEALAASEGIETLVGGFIAFGVGADGRPFLEPPTGPVSAIAEQRRFWEQFMTAVRTELEAGTPPARIAGKMDMSQFEDYRGYDPDSMEILVRRISSLYITGR